MSDESVDFDEELEDEIDEETELEEELSDPDPKPEPAKRGRPKGTTKKTTTKKAEPKKVAKGKEAKAAKNQTPKPKAERKPALGAPIPSRPLLNKDELKNCAEKAILCKQAGDATRMSVIAMLAKHEETHVGALCASLGQSQSAVSHHLALLRAGGVVEQRRQGKNNFYSLTDRGKRISTILSA